MLGATQPTRGLGVSVATRHRKKCVCGGGGAQEQLQNKQKLENTTNNNLVRNNEKKIMTPKSAKYEIKKKEIINHIALKLHQIII